MRQKQVKPNYEAAVERCLKEYPNLPRERHEVAVWVKAVVDAAIGDAILVQAEDR